MDPNSIEKEALKLPMSARAALAKRLLESLDQPSNAELEQLWFDEAARRAAEIDDGTVVLVPSDMVSRKERSLLR